MRKRIAVIDLELCKPDKCNSECVNVCPVNRKGQKCVKVDKKRAYIDESLCIGCGICVKKCPFHAISVVNLPQALKEQPIYRFGENGFSLFRLPMPGSKKNVVGLLGSNGIGKTTSLRILSGEIEPNLGYRDDDVEWEKIIEIYRGTELQDYMEKLSKDDISISIKPQRMDKIKRPNSIVRDVIDGSNKFVNKLGMNSFLDKKIGNLSGGELQKLAIALCLSKEADLYLLDEPSSHLDIKQRLNMSRVVRGVSKDKNIIVVEHDLATLDLLADKIHIFYGQPSVYGVVSKPYSVRKGINTFLDGYIKEDNMRFREKTIFDIVGPKKEIKKDVLLKFTDLNKEWKNFSLSVESGVLYKEEIIGVLGANALGKTTFAKMLTKEMDFEGRVDEEVRIAYKPQYLSSDFKDTVRRLLSTVDKVFSKDNKINVLEPLGIMDLIDKKIYHLSGGELQKVAIGLCLSKDVDLYLLDEPSAYLDVDQRLALAKILQNKTAFVIDHDLLFLSYISNRAMLFTGVPGKKGHGACIGLEKGMNKFLRRMDITFRRDKETKRPRANKPDSVKDRKQKQAGNYFYRV